MELENNPLCGQVCIWSSPTVITVYMQMLLPSYSRGSYHSVWQIELESADFLTSKNLWDAKICKADVIFMNNVRYEQIQTALNVCSWNHSSHLPCWVPNAFAQILIVRNGYAHYKLMFSTLSTHYRSKKHLMITGLAFQGESAWRNENCVHSRTEDQDSSCESTKLWLFEGILCTLSQKNVNGPFAALMAILSLPEVVNCSRGCGSSWGAPLTAYIYTINYRFYMASQLFFIEYHDGKMNWYNIIMVTWLMFLWNGS